MISNADFEKKKLQKWKIWVTQFYYLYIRHHTVQMQSEVSTEKFNLFDVQTKWRFPTMSSIKKKKKLIKRFVL